MDCPSSDPVCAPPSPARTSLQTCIHINIGHLRSCSFYLHPVTINTWCVLQRHVEGCCELKVYGPPKWKTASVSPTAETQQQDQTDSQEDRQERSEKIPREKKNKQTNNHSMSVSVIWRILNVKYTLEEKPLMKCLGFRGNFIYRQDESHQPQCFLSSTSCCQ